MSILEEAGSRLAVSVAVSVREASPLGEASRRVGGQGEENSPSQYPVPSRGGFTDMI